MRTHRRGGWMFTDALIAMGILGAGIALLAATLSRVTTGARTVSQHRTALRMANEAMLQLQTEPAAALATGITLEEDAAPAPAGWRWVRVNAVHHHGHARLSGLIRSNP